MTEYITIEPEATGDPLVMCLLTNVDLTQDGEVEVYPDATAGAEGSALAQTLFSIPGLAALTLDGGEMLITRTKDAEWHDLAEDISDALRDFFL